MKNRLLIPFIVILIIGNAVNAQSLISIENIDNGSADYNSWVDMQKYSIDVNKRFKDENAPIYLYGVYHEEHFKNLLAPQRIRLAYDNTLMFNTHNILAGYNPGKLGSFNAYLSGRVGWGYAASEYFLKTGDAGEEKAKINSSFGAEFELEHSFDKNNKNGLYNLNYFIGTGISYVSPENYDNTQRNNGTVIDPFFGLRYYFWNLSAGGVGEAHRVYIQAKAGAPFTNGFNYEDGNASTVYFSFGAGITSLQSLSKIKDITLADLFMLPETGVYVSPPGGVAYAQLTQPIRIASNLSLGFNGQLGTGISKAERNDLQPTSFWGVGGDFRFFDAQGNAYMNPYLGVMFNTYEYTISDEKSKGSVTYMRIGDKINLFNSNWYLDANIGVPLTSKDVWIENEDADRNIENIPVTIDFNIGLFYKFKAKRDRPSARYRAEHYVFSEDQLPLIEDADLAEKGPLPFNAEADSMLVETRIYIQQHTDTIFEVLYDTLGIPMYPDLDVTNIRVGRYVDPKETVVRFDDWSVVPADTSSVSKEPVTLFLIGLDTRNSDTGMIGDTNMFLVFNDLNRSRLFGFNYNAKNVMRPETRQGELDLTGKDPFYGNYEKYVIPLKWLNNSQYDVADIQKRTSWSSENYKIAYTKFDKALFEKVAAHCPDFGVSVLFNIKNPEGKATQFLSNVLGGKRKFIAGAYAEEVTRDAGHYMRCEPESITRFDLSGDELNKRNQIKAVEEVAKKAMFCKIVRIAGYTDGVEFKPKSEAKVKFMDEMRQFEGDEIVNRFPNLKSTWQEIMNEWKNIDKTEANKAEMERLSQKALAWRRIRQVLVNLQPCNHIISGKIDPGLIIEPLGNEYTATKKQNANERKVVVYFE